MSVPKHEHHFFGNTHASSRSHEADTKSRAATRNSRTPVNILVMLRQLGDTELRYKSAISMREKGKALGMCSLCLCTAFRFHLCFFASASLPEERHLFVADVSYKTTWQDEARQQTQHDTFFSLLTLRESVIHRLT